MRRPEAPPNRRAGHRASYNKPTSITRGTNIIGFSHDPEHQRFQQVAPGGTTLYIAGSGVLA